jgi:hypothetical protein
MATGTMTPPEALAMVLEKSTAFALAGRARGARGGAGRGRREGHDRGAPTLRREDQGQCPPAAPLAQPRDDRRAPPEARGRARLARALAGLTRLLRDGAARGGLRDELRAPARPRGHGLSRPPRAQRRGAGRSRLLRLSSARLADRGRLLLAGPLRFGAASRERGGAGADGGGFTAADAGAGVTFTG